MEIFQTFALVLLVVGQAATLVAILLRRKQTAADMHELGVRYAEQAVRYAEQLGGSKEAKLSNAINAFRLSDETSDGKRDFTDAQARVLVEAAISKMKG